jgi:hypothetical protein
MLSQQIRSEHVKKIAAFFHHDYEIDGPSYYRPKRPIFSLIVTMFMWLGFWVSIDSIMRFIYADVTQPAMYKNPWMLLWFAMPGATMWWMDKLRYREWLASRRELPPGKPITFGNTGAQS